MSRRELLKQLGWEDALIDFFMITDEDNDLSQSVSYSMNDIETSTLTIGNSYSANDLQVVINK